MTAPARVLLFIGGLAAAFAWWGFAAQQTLLDPSATRDAAAGLLSAPPVQDAAIGSLANQLEGLVPRDVSQKVATNAQARQVAHQAALSALRDPELRRAFANAIASLQQQLIDGDSSRRGLSVDTAAVTAAVRHAVARVDPSLVAKMPKTPLKLHFDTSHLPSLRGVHKHTGTFTLFAALIALLAWGGAVLVHREPWTAVRVIGRRLVMIGALPLVFWVLIPAGLRAMHFAAAEVTTPLASAYGRRLAPPAFAVLGIGATLWLLGRFNGFVRRGPRAGCGSGSGSRSRGVTSYPPSNPIAYTRRGGEAVDRVDLKV